MYSSRYVLAKMEVLKEKMLLQEKQMTLVKNMADIIPKIEKNVTSIINLREQVEKSVSRLQDSKEKVENYMIDDDLLSTNDNGETIDNTGRIVNSDGTEPTGGDDER